MTNVKKPAWTDCPSAGWEWPRGVWMDIIQSRRRQESNQTVSTTRWKLSDRVGTGTVSGSRISIWYSLGRRSRINLQVDITHCAHKAFYHRTPMCNAVSIRLLRSARNLERCFTNLSVTFKQIVGFIAASLVQLLEFWSYCKILYCQSTYEPCFFVFLNQLNN